MFDISEINFEDVKDDMEQVESLLDSAQSIKDALKTQKKDLGDKMGMNSKQLNAFLKMYASLKEEGSVAEEDLVFFTKEIYSKLREI